MKTEENFGRYVGYEYKEVKTDSAQASFLIDGYANFGWQVDQNLAGGLREESVKPPGVPGSLGGFFHTFYTGESRKERQRKFLP